MIDLRMIFRRNMPFFFCVLLATTSGISSEALSSEKSALNISELPKTLQGAYTSSDQDQVVDASLLDWSKSLKSYVNGEKAFVLLLEGKKFADVSVNTSGYSNVSMQFPTGIIETGYLDDARMFIAVIPVDSEPAYLEFSRPMTHHLDDQDDLQSVILDLPNHQLDELEEALASLNLNVQDVELSDFQLIPIKQPKFDNGENPVLLCNETACYLAILALDVAIIAAVAVCAGSLGTGCLGAAAGVAAAGALVAQACEGCGGGGDR